VSGDDVATLTKYFEGLSQGGTVTEPLGPHPWGATFGMLIDKFGISWMVNITTE
jgi:PhnB protein